MTHIILLGDSITYGAWDSQGGWAQRLRMDIDQKNLSQNGFYALVYNLGISGDTSDSVCKRFENELKPRIDSEEETEIIIAIGANDATLNLKAKKCLVPLKKYERNMNKLITIAKKYAKKIMVVGITPVDEKRTNPIPWFPGYAARNDCIEQYNEAARTVSLKNNVIFVDMFQVLRSKNYAALLNDGEHPNDEGHKIMYETIKKELVKNGFFK